MKEFRFVVTETLTAEAYIAADTEQEARAELKRRYEADEIIAINPKDVEFQLVGVDVLGEPRDMTFARFDIFDAPALFTELRPSDIVGVPDLDKLYRYDLRHGDDDSFPVTLEHRVVVNRFGTIFTAVPLLDEHVRSRSITDDDWGFCSDLADCTPTEFLAELEKENADV